MKHHPTKVALAKETLAIAHDGAAELARKGQPVACAAMKHLGATVAALALHAHGDVAGNVAAALRTGAMPSPKSKSKKAKAVH